MNHINKYYSAIEKQIKLGANNEQNLRPHFYELLKHYTDSENLLLQYEQREKTDLFDNYPDGKISRQTLPVGHIENKDPKDNLSKEIDKKLNDRNYPKNNIIFENSVRLVLYQAGKKVEDIDMSNAEELNRVLLKFVQYQTEEQKEFIEALDNLKKIVPKLAQELREFFVAEELVNNKFKEKLQEFLAECRQSINKYLNKDDVFEIIIQHILTEDIFIIFFSDAEFHKQNAIAQTVNEVMNTLKDKKREIQLKIDDYILVLKKYIYLMSKEDKKDVLKVFYEDFYTALNAKKADVQGVVYTPLAVVRFMIEATDQLLYRYFDKSLASEGVKILDPCTGTGVFMSELIEHIPAQNLPYKYEHELFVSEIDIMPYYIANLNIEYSYFEKTNTYKSFENICLIDSLEFQKEGEQLFGIAHFNNENLERAIKQYEQEISVVIGNPPYNANQQSENDNNKNKVYTQVDSRIKETYIKESTAQKTKQFDMYKRFVRWASDRIKDHGMISFITNNAYLDSRQDDGFRKCIQKEFDYVYIYDLGGNVRKNPKLSGTKNNVFGIQVGVSIVFLIKKSNVTEKKAKIFYTRMPELATAKEKLFELTRYTGKFEDISFEQIIPKANGQWLGQTNNDFDSHPALISKEVKNKGIGDDKAIFQMFSGGVLTARDNWAYDKNPQQLAKKVQKFSSVYDKERTKYKGKKLDDIEMKDSLDYSIKWSEHIKLRMIANKPIDYDNNKIRTSLYRPFCKQYLYFDSSYVDRQLQNPNIFPLGIENENLVINFSLMAHEFKVLASNLLTSYDVTTHNTLIPLYVYNDKGERHDNITEWGLNLFRERYHKEITSEQVLQYCYAVLSSPTYQSKYADNLKTDYPRIPLHDDEGSTTFEYYRSRGERLIDLHAEYMNTTPYNDLTITRNDDYIVEGIENPNKNTITHPMKLDKKLGILHLDAQNRIANIPLEAFDYKIGSRSALDWIVEYHKFKKLNPAKELHHKTLIDEGLDLYDWQTIRAELFELVPKIVRVSVETLRIYKELSDKEGREWIEMKN